MKKTYQLMLIIFFGLFALGQLQRVQISSNVAFYLHDLVIFCWVVLFLTTHHSSWKISWKKIFFKTNTQLFILFLFISWSLFSLFVNSITLGWQPYPWLYLSRLLIYSIFSISLAIIKPFKQSLLYFGWALTGILIAFGGILQYFIWPDTRFLVTLGWDDHFNRLISTQFDPNFTGILLILTFWLINSITELSTKLKILLQVITLFAILLTYSRASFLSLAISLIFILIYHHVKKMKNIKFVLYLGLLIVGIFYLPAKAGEGTKLTRTYSITSRINSSKQAINLNQPLDLLIGNGLFSLAEDSQGIHTLTDTAHFPDNIFAMILNSTGIIGLGLFLSLIYYWGKFLYQKNHYIFAAFLAVLLHTQFNHTLFQPFIWLWMTSQSTLLVFKSKLKNNI